VNDLFFTEEEQRQKWQREESQSGNAAIGVRG
jgi:hypothetical protein